MRILSVLLLLIALSGCASMVKQGAMIRAQENFTKGDYQEVINITEHSMQAYDNDDEEKAQLLFLKAQSYQKMDDVPSAISILTYIANKFPSTEHGFRAQRILKNVEE